LLDWLIESEITPPIAARVVWVYRLWLWLWLWLLLWLLDASPVLRALG
jgi:hypothetical protein